MFTKWNRGSSFAEVGFQSTTINGHPNNTMYFQIDIKSQQMQYHCQTDRFYDAINYNFFDEADDLQEYAIQYDECEQDTRWEQWSNWGGCSVTCGGGRQQRARQCQKKDANGFWVDAPELVGQSCQCQALVQLITHNT